MIKRLYNEFVKNLKIMFRNWASLSLLVIAPLVLILLIGYAFSSEEVSGMRIGIISEEKIYLAPLAYNISSYAVIQEFADVEDCLSEMALQRVHLCVGLEGVLLENKNETDIGNVPSGKVVYYYDNTRKRLSMALIQNIQGFFGVKAEQISIESTESIIENIQNLVIFLNERKEDINQIKNESKAIRAELVDRKEKLERLRANFLPPYLVIKDAQARLHNYSSRLDISTNNLTETIDTTVFAVRQVRNNTVVSSGILDNLTGVNTGIDNYNLDNQLKNLETELLIFSRLLNSTSADTNLVISNVDLIIGNLDIIKEDLDEEIARNDEYIRKIDQNIVKIDETSKELENKLSQLGRLEPGLAKRLVKPILYEYNKVLENTKNIQLSFPQLLVIIIMFIALLFANISTLMEIHNKAYLRNLIAPVDDILYVIGMLLTGIVLVFFQIVVLFIVAQTKFGIMITQIPWQAGLISILLIMLFILMGMMFAYLFKTVQSSILVTTFSALIFFLFSNSLLPIEAMPSFARFLSGYNPIVIGEYLFKEVQLFNTPMAYLIQWILLLVIYICILFLLVIALAKNKNRMKG